MSTEHETEKNGARSGNGATPGTDTASGAARSSARKSTRGAATPPDPMADVRRETGDFEFGALLKGVGGEEREASPREPFRSVLPERVPSAEESFRPVLPGPAPAAPSSAPAARRGMPVAGWIGIALALAIPVGFFIGNSMSGQRAVATPPSATGAIAKATEATGGRKPGMPDPALTPGHRLPNARKEVVISEAARLQVLKAYGIDPEGEGKKMVIVRLIPASLGGTEEPANLFPTTPWFVDLKVRLDRYLADQVLRGGMTVEEAEKVLTTNWIAALHRYNIRNYGHADRKAAEETEKKLSW
jgi:hypothetical protein